MAERNNRERPAGHRHDTAANQPTASTPSSFLSRVFRGSTHRGTVSEQSIPTISTSSGHHADIAKHHPSSSPTATASNGSGPSPGISPILSPQLLSSSTSRRTKSKSPTRARQRLQDITTAGIANLSLYEEGEDEESGPTSVGILRHFSQTSGTGRTRGAMPARRPARSADQLALRDLVKNLVFDEDSSSNNPSHIQTSHLSSHERANLAIELAAELRIRMEDAVIERRLKATLADDPSVSVMKQRLDTGPTRDPLFKVIAAVMGPETDVADTVERLLILPSRLIREGDLTKQSSGQNLKTAGFQLLAILLLMRTSDATEQSLAQQRAESQHETRFRSAMIDLCLSSSVDLPTSGQTMSTTPSNFDFSLGDMPNRIACLQVLTRRGRDITLNQNIVRTLVKWHHILLVGWKQWCAEPGAWDSSENGEGNADGESRGRQNVVGASSERDQSNSTITIHFAKDSFEWATEDLNVPIIVRSLRSIWEVLVAIITHNLPLFSGRDIETILDMAVTMVTQGIESTSLASPQHFTSITTESEPHVAKLETPSGTQPPNDGRARSGSLLSRNRTLKVPAAPPTTSDAGLSQAAPMVSRSPSLKTKDRHPNSHGTSLNNATTPEYKSTPTTGMSARTPPWATALDPVLDLLQFLLEARYLPPMSLVSVIQLLCLCYGWRSNLKSAIQPSRPMEAMNGVMNNLDQRDQCQIEEFFKNLFTSKLVSRNAERCLRNLLGGQVKFDAANDYERQPDFKRDIVIGALGLTRVLLQTTYIAAQEKNVHAHELSPNFNLQSLAPTLLASMSDGGETSSAGRGKWAEVDVQILCIVDDYLTDLSCTTLAISEIEASTVSLDARQTNTRDPWYEGHLICQFLQRGLMLAKGSDIILDLHSQNTLRTISDPVALKMSVIMCRLPAVLGGLQSGPSSGLYLHTDFVHLLMQIPADLNQDLALRVIDFYKREGLCLPPHSDWIDNINKVMEAFFVGHYKAERSSKKEIRQSAANLLFEHVYDYVQDFTESRTQLISKCMLPVLERTLPSEEDEAISDKAWETLISAAVLETMDEDERKRASQRNASSDAASLAESIDTLPLGLPDTLSSCSARMRRLILSTGCNESCNHDAHLSAQPTTVSRRTTPMPAEQPTDDRMRSNARARSTHDQLHTQSPDLSGSVSSSTFRDIMGSFSPTFFSSNKDVPPISQSISSLPAAVTSSSSTKPTGDVPEPRSPMGRDPTPDARDARTPNAGQTCKAVRTVKALIAIFTRLAFSLPRSLRADTLRLSRVPASARCIVIFTDMLQLLWVKYVASHHEQLARRDPERNGQSAEWHLSCQHARLILLQWLVRLRANKQHRIWIKPYLDDGAEPMADLLGRSAKKLKTSSEESSLALPEEGPNRRRKPQPEVSQAPPSTTERGRVGRAPGFDNGSGRSRSRSRQPPTLASIPSAPPHRPIWQIPHVLDFEVPPDARPSEGMTTYDPLVSEKDAHGVEGIWLPVSDYMSVAVAMLAEEKDWELMSYLLIFLPLQMANKHLFCGPKSSQAIRQLRRLICDGLLSGNLLSHIRLPIRPSEVLPAAYQLLSMLISYKSLFNKGEISAMLDVLVKGLQGQTTEIMRSSIQTLTIAVHEVTESVSQHLNSILELLANLITKGKVSIHALEFLNAVGSVPSLYANFTDEQYLTVFKVAIAYIQLHHQRTKDADETISDQDRVDFTESQHVITMSYHAIYVWFLALSLDKRPTVVPFLSRNLMHAFTDGRIDEMAEVCYDWLARYTYGNADPKPTVSFLSEVVMHGDFSGTDKSISETAVTKSWLLGNTVLTIKTQPRSGWVTINAVRPSGTVSLLTKVENVPLLGLGEDNADLDSLPAVLMADRRVQGSITNNKEDTDSTNPNQDSNNQNVMIKTESNETVERRNSSDYIWSGTSPSQRRKDVAILPGFVGLQLSAYPYISVDSPRGRLIPPDDRKLQVMIRNLDYIPIIDSHCIAVLYVGPGQKDEVDIFSNTDGSPAFLTFMAGLGRLIRLKGQKDVYTGGLDTNSDEDGEYAYAWWDDLSQTIFHAPHLMPNRPVIDGQKDFYSYKKRHVGNDYVHVIFNDSGEDYRFDTISTQFRFVNVIISSHTAGVSGSAENPSDHDFFKVTIQKKPGIPDFSPIGDFKLVAAKALPVLIRQIALSANVMAQVFNHVETQGNMPYLTPWRQRYRQILRIKDSLPVLAHGENEDELDKLVLLRDFTRGF